MVKNCVMIDSECILMVLWILIIADVTKVFCLCFCGKGSFITANVLNYNANMSLFIYNLCLHMPSSFGFFFVFYGARYGHVMWNLICRKNRWQFLKLSIERDDQWTCLKFGFFSIERDLCKVFAHVWLCAYVSVLNISVHLSRYELSVYRLTQSRWNMVSHVLMNLYECWWTDGGMYEAMCNVSHICAYATNHNHYGAN